MRKTLAHRVMFWDDERNIGNSLIVTLQNGWQFGTDPFQEEHVQGFDTVREAETAIRKAIPCKCTECSAAMRPVETEDAD